MKVSLAKGGAKSLLTQAQEDQLVQHIQEQFENHELVNTQTIEDYVWEHFNIKAKQSWISKFCKRKGFTSKKTQIRPAKRDCDCLDQDVHDYRYDMEGTHANTRFTYSV